MSENNTPKPDKKENTLDILVSPKKKEEPKEILAPKKETAPSGASAGKTVSSGAAKKAVPKKTVAVKAAQTRKIPASGVKGLSVKSKTEKAVSSFSAEKLSAGLKDAGSAVKKAYSSLKKTSGEKKEKAKKPAVKRPMTPEEKKSVRASMGYTATIALIYIAVVVGISAILSFVGIRWANDIFALVKDEVVATITIPENATVSEVSNLLKEKDLIEYPSVFRFYINFKNRDSENALTFKPGDHEISSTLNYDQIVSKIKDRKTRKIITLTIPEGYTVDETIDLFLSNGMGTRAGFVEAINNFDYDYVFMDKLDAIKLSDKRKYRLEGYLFPDTYEFYTDSSEVAIVDKLLAAFEAHFEEDYYLRLEELGMNLDQVVTLASIVQKEGKFISDFYPIAGVFYNRLKSNNMKRLQSDATVQYCLEERKEELSYKDLEVDSPYNTYRNAGLPPSAISNPGWEAIQATLYPETNSHYYFISDTDGSIIFADTEAQHLANAAKLKAAKENGTSID